MGEMIKRINRILSAKEKKKIIVLFFLMVVGSFLELMGVSLVLPLIEMIMQTPVDAVAWKREFLRNAGILAVVYLLKNGFLAYMFHSIYSFVYQGSSRLSAQMLHFYMKQPYAFHLNRNLSVMQRTICHDVKGFYIVVRQLLQIVAEVLICVVLTVFLFYTDFFMTLFLMLVLGGCVGAFLLVAKKQAKKLGQEDLEYQGKINQWVMQAIGGVKEIQVLGREDFFVDQFRFYNQKSARTNRKQQFLLQIPRLVTETICIWAVVLFLMIKVGQGNDLQSMVPTLAIFVVAAFRLLPCVGKINGYITELMFYRGCVDFIYDDLTKIGSENLWNKECREEKENVHPPEEVLGFEREVELRDISFRYENSDKMVLENINFQIPKGKSVALVGPSGIGKTTLADLVMGVLSPTEGIILVDGENIRNHRYRWYAQIGYVPQTIFLSDDTIRNNVAFGIPEEEIQEKQVWDALRKAQLETFVKGLEEGLDTKIGERGVRISGGQRQRIGIARALYHDPQLLVLDEATSALDQDTESDVMEAIEHLHGEKTMLIIAHRLTTIEKCDAIYDVGERKMKRNRQ